MHCIEQKLFYQDKCYYEFKAYRSNSTDVSDTNELTNLQEQLNKTRNFSKKTVTYPFIVKTYLDGIQCNEKTKYITCDGLPNPKNTRRCIIL